MLWVPYVQVLSKIEQLQWHGGNGIWDDVHHELCVVLMLCVAVAYIRTVHTYIHTYTHTHLRTHIRAYVQACIVLSVCFTHNSALSMNGVWPERYTFCQIRCHCTMLLEICSADCLMSSNGLV